jgi:membrane protease YdiL (CAAX protease family)
MRVDLAPHAAILRREVDQPVAPRDRAAQRALRHHAVMPSVPPAAAFAIRPQAWAPIAVLTSGAAVPGLRPVVLAVLAVVAIATTARGGARTPTGRACLATLPAAVGLTWAGLAGTPMPLPDALHCTDLLSPPTVTRVVQAILVLGTLALVAPLAGSHSALRLRRPTDRRVTALALVAPLVLVPGALWIGPQLARPFFGEVGLATGDLRAIIPAAAFAVANAALEETAYRGALLGWSTPALGLAGAVVGQAVVFGFAHLGADVTGPAPVLWLGMAASGVVAGLVAVRSRSLLLPFAVHAALDVPLFYAFACRVAT